MAIIDDLSARKYSVQTDFFPPDLIAELLRDLVAQRERGALTRAEIGRAGQDHLGVRTDMTLWLDGESGAQNEYLRLMDALRMDINRDLMLGLFEFEAHYAQYEAGGFYKKHLDALQGARGRIVSTVTYLTPGWGANDGGHLVLYDDMDAEMLRILPQSGTVALFMSEDIPHEVLPPARPRCSIAGWFRCRS